MEKRKILFATGRYVPGYKSGGPVRTTKNVIDALHEEYDFRVVCKDRDRGDAERYPGIKINEWNQVGNALVYYVPEDEYNSRLFLELSKQVDLLYIWGCFDAYSMNLLRLKRENRIKIPVVVASMGLFSPNAFRMKYVKKKLVTTLFNMTGMYEKIYWSVTSKREAADLKKQIRVRDDQILIAEDLPRRVDDHIVHKEKEKGHLKVVWISRISWEKNLLGAMDLLAHVKSDIQFTIYGPTAYDPDCWAACEPRLRELPPNIHWKYEGTVESEQVVQTLRKHHVFLFPTLGENYGHVIQEALSAGCPCIISDQTPWRDLEENGVGHVFPLEDTDSFVRAVEEYAAMSEREFNEAANRAVRYAARNSNEKVKNTGYRKIFELG